MSRCARCERPIEPAPVHRTAAGDFHGGCLDDERRELEERAERRRRSAVDGQDATRGAGRR